MRDDSGDDKYVGTNELWELAEAGLIEALEKDAQMCQIEIHNLQKLIADQSEIEDAVKGLDVLAFKVEELRKEISGLREVDKDIMTQHEKIFEWMANSSPMQQKGNPYN